MKEFIQKIFVKKEDFDSFKTEIDQSNRSSFLVIGKVGICFSAVLIFLSLPFIGVLHLVTVYLHLGIFLAMFYVIGKAVLEKHPSWGIPFYYVILLILDLIAIYMGTVKGVDTNATTFLLFLLVFPLFLKDRPWHMNLFNFLMAVGFIVTALKIKPAGVIRNLDLSNAIVVYLLSAVFMEFNMQKVIDVYRLQAREEKEIQEKNHLIADLPIGIGVYEVRNGQAKQTFLNQEFYDLFEDTPEARAARTNGNFMNSIHPADRNNLGMAMKKMIDGENDHFTMSCRSQKGDGTYLWVRFASVAVDRSEGFLKVYSTYSSMEEEMKSKQATQAKTEFLSRISHDMRTPLNGILGLTGLIKEKTQDPSIQRDLDQLQMSGNYLLNLINDTLDVSKIESGKLELHPEVCESKVLVENIETLIRQTIDARHIHVVKKMDHMTFGILYIDVPRVQQVMMNVLGNAVKFTPPGGTISLEMKNLSRTETETVDQIRISDTGIGMSEEFLPHLFEPFTREETGTTAKVQGTGLGMTITKQIIELMGGTIQVESKLGKGTTFTFVLPMKLATEEQIQEWRIASSRPVDHSKLYGRRILLCEDHPLNAEIATRLLKSQGIEVEHAENGKIGVEMFNASEPKYYDAILMDIRMPVMDGLQAARAIRASGHSDATRIPIIALTANAFDEDVRNAEIAGIDEHLGKPIESDKLFTVLQRLIQTPRHVRIQVLIVDDEEVNRAVIRNPLEDEFDIFEASSGTEALAILKEHPRIVVVVTDIQMPGMDGKQLIQAIRDNPLWYRIIVIANTQYGEPNQVDELLNIGANDFVYKPTNPKLVALRVKNALKMNL